MALASRRFDATSPDGSRDAVEGGQVMRTLRNLGRRKLRTTLTVSGITIGIWALVVFGALASKINGLVSGAHDYFGDRVVVSSASGGGGMFPLPLSMVDDARRVAGVAVAYGQVDTMVDHSAHEVGVPDEMVGFVAGGDAGRDTYPYRYAAGRPLTSADEGSNVVVLGADVARKRAAKVGSIVQFRDVDFTVVGILEPTLTVPDSQALMPLSAVQLLYVQELPDDLAEGLVPADTITNIVIYPTPGTNVDDLADRLEAALPEVVALTAHDFDQTIGSTATLLSAIIVGVGLISLIVGGLSVINTMAMSVNERTREIGIKRAVGASRRRIVVEFVGEAGAIGLLGGLIGLGLGSLVVLAGNELGRSSGTYLFELTAGTAFGALVFACVLGMVAGVFPAAHAARLDPVSALHYE
jgi:putative ABC transport system permease protein